MNSSPRSNTLSAALREVPAATAVAAGTLGVTAATVISLKQMTGQYARYAIFGPLDGLLCWMAVGLAAWFLAFAGVERRRDRRSGGDTWGRPGRWLRSLGDSSPDLFAFLGLHALTFVVGLAAMTLAWGLKADACLLGCLVGFGVLLPVGLLSPWAATRALIARSQPDAGPFGSALYGWGSFVVRPLRFLRAVFGNLLVLAAVGIPVQAVMDRANVPFETGLLGALAVLAIGAVHIQLEAASMADAEDVRGAEATA